MASTAVLLLQLLLVPLASASHLLGTSATYTYRGQNPDGTYKVDLHTKSIFKNCDSLPWSCSGSNCLNVARSPLVVIDRNINTPISTCVTETVFTTNVSSDKPFQMRSSSCCWRSTANNVRYWHLLTEVDLGKRSDTRKPNRSPDIDILPYLRVPQNCPRTYKLTSFDPDGDKVRCRYGNVRGRECDSCNLPPGFLLDQDSCTLHYNYTRANINAFALELVVEDFPQSYINLQYADGSRSYRTPMTVRRGKRSSIPPPATQYPPTAPTPAPPTTPAPAPPTTPAPTPAPPTTPAPTPPTTPARPPPPPTTTTTPTPTGPLSKLPMQFSFLVDPPAPSCQEGAFLPKLLPPTPANGDSFLAEVNKELEIRVKAHATNARINNIFVTGPANISKHQTTHGEFVLRWTPLPDDHGQHFVICFAVEAVNPPAVYQSEMRCVLVEARSEIVKSHVICNESSMTVSVEKASFPRLHEDHMQLNDPSNTACSLQRLSNSTHIIATIPLNACGTQIEEDEENLIFKNEITTVDNPSDLITRKHQLEVQFYCQYPKRGNVSLSFVAHRKNITVWEKGFGTFTYQFEFYPNNQFQTRMDPAAYPLEYDIGNRIYMKIKATSSVNNTELFVESCRAAPYDNPNYRPTYSIFENGCQMDPTLQIHSPANQKEFKFSMEAFKFIGLNNQVYISCSVMMCEAGNSDTRCSKGCINSTSTGPRRAKREAVIQSASHFVSQGPLRLRRSAERVGATATNLNLNLVFIAGCVLAAVGMVCGVVMYRAKVTKVKYQPLPAFES